LPDTLSQVHSGLPPHVRKERHLLPILDKMNIRYLISLSRLMLANVICLHRSSGDAESTEVVFVYNCDWKWFLLSFCSLFIGVGTRIFLSRSRHFYFQAMPRCWLRIHQAQRTLGGKY